MLSIRVRPVTATPSSAMTRRRCSLMSSGNNFASSGSRSNMRPSRILAAGLLLDAGGFVGSGRMDVAVGAAARIGGRFVLGGAVEAANTCRAAGLPGGAGARPAGAGGAAVDCRRFVRIGGDEVVVEVA